MPEDGQKEVLKKWKDLDVRPLQPVQTEPVEEGFKKRLAKAFTSLKLKAALGHVGLLLSLCVYCAVGGIVSIYLI